MGDDWVFYYCKICDLNFATNYDFGNRPYCPSCALDEDIERVKKEDDDEAEY